MARATRSSPRPTRAGTTTCWSPTRGGWKVQVAVLDSVQSQANRLEQALRLAHERGEIRLPLGVRASPS
ncbi:MAG TPA: type I-U CRISPR-associated protein Cas7 [Candidatus Dormibacteraeota bacterium]|nr:type I-U CRISPR-associated protein Cas7 [Candidatus Dormibacteraeota bacterium]